VAFTELATDIYEIDGIEGASFLLDCTGVVPVAPLFPFLSSTDASQLQFSPKIPDGVTLGPRIARQFGFRWVMSNGWELWALDAQASKPAEHLGYAAPGWRFVFRMPKADFPAAGPDDVHRIDKLVISGHHEFYTFNDQPEVTPEEIASGDGRPFPRSIEIYHKEKYGTVEFSDGTLRDDYRVGKAGCKLPPMAFPRNSSTGEVGPPIFGYWEHSVLPNGDYLGTKCWDKATVQAALATAGTFDEIMVDATLGYTTIGGSFLTSIDCRAMAVPIAPEDGTIQSYHLANRFGFATDAIGGYSESATPGKPGAVLEQVGTAADGSWRKGTSVTNPTFSTGDKLWVAFAEVSAEQIFYDVITSDFSNWSIASLASSNLPDPFDTLGTEADNGTTQKLSAYFTYSVATSPPVTTNTAVDPSSVPQGVSSDLSADITDADHTITAAEYFIGADPGEGSGTAMSLGAGTTSREATATIATGALAVDDHTVSVRGFDATDGWGAVDTTTLTVTEPVAGAKVVGLMAGVGRMMGG
jgi:hypothetical protein